MSDYDPLWEEGKSDLIDRIHELEDAAEFSERVALKIASTHGGFSFCDEYCGRYNIYDCRWCRLKWARLAVEEEMECRHF